MNPLLTAPLQSGELPPPITRLIAAWPDIPLHLRVTIENTVNALLDAAARGA